MLNTKGKSTCALGCINTYFKLCGKSTWVLGCVNTYFKLSGEPTWVLGCINAYSSCVKIRAIIIIIDLFNVGCYL